jgi:hypothetical protein
MSNWRRPPRVPTISRGAARALALLAALITTSSASAEIFKKEDLLRGITIPRAQCEATERTLWLNVRGRDFCVRYYLSTAGGEGTRPVVLLQGDQLGKFNPRTWTWTDTSEAKDVDTANIIGENDALSKFTKTTAIYLARIGVDGTSGNHLARKSVLEFDLMNAALDALKQRYGFEGFHLAGQSGGSLLVGGLAELRHDIGCAVIGSGRLIPPELPKSKDPAKSPFDPIESISQLVKNSALRVLVVTDKADKRVPAAQQIGFVDRLHRAGRQVPQFFVETTDDLRHGVTSYTELAVAGCILNRPDEEIAKALATLSRRNAEYNQRRQKETKDKAAIQTAARQPVEGLATAAAAKK